MPRVLNTLFHLVNLVAYSFTLYYAFYILHIPLLINKFSKFDPGQLKYLTMWNVVSNIFITVNSLSFFLNKISDTYNI